MADLRRADLRTHWPLLDGGIALTIFLVFHRVRDFSDRLIEELFFRQWRSNDVALRQSVTEAAINISTALLRRRSRQWRSQFDGLEAVVRSY